MIHILHQENTLEIKGHSDSAPRGYDIICAGISAIATTAFTKWETNDFFNLVEDHKVPSISIHLSKERYDLKSSPEYIEYAFFIFQLKLMADHHTDYITFQAA